METGARNSTRLIRFVSAPIRVLAKVQNLYVRTISDYADRIGRGNTGCPGGTQIFP